MRHNSQEVEVEMEFNKGSTFWVMNSFSTRPINLRLFKLFHNFETGLYYVYFFMSKYRYTNVFFNLLFELEFCVPFATFWSFESILSSFLNGPQPFNKYYIQRTDSTKI